MNRWRYTRRLAFLARRLGIGHNPLRRTVDRTETAVLLAAFLIAAAVVPFAMSIGTTVYHHQLVGSAVETSQRHQVTAVLTQDVPLNVGTAGTNAATLSPARWTDVHGVRHTGLVPASPGSSAGSSVRIWNDNQGDLANAPLTPDQALARGVGVFVVVMLGVAIALGCGYWLVHNRLERVRARAWESEWRVIGPRWTTRAN